MVTLQQLQNWLEAPDEYEHLEFKEAKTQFDQNKLLKYCAALANEGSGHLILGVSDKKPRVVTGSSAFSNATELNRLKKTIVDKLSLRVDVTEIIHPEGRVLVFYIPSRPQGQPIPLEGAYWMRAGESLKPMTPDMLKRIFDEGTKDWLSQNVKDGITADDVIALLDTQSYFDLIKEPYPTTQKAVLEKLANKGFISQSSYGWSITNLAAITLAKKLEDFPHSISSKATRFIIYEGKSKLKTREEMTSLKGYAVGFDELVNFIHSSAPRNQFIEEAVRNEVKMFPKQAIRELLANALIHQNFAETGIGVLIEMYDDRIEFSNPGAPPIRVERFIDENKAPNENLANLMRKFGICEEKGSGVDKVVHAAEVFQLPAPNFIVGDLRTTSILFAHQDFAQMSKNDRIRACYQHCCLMYVTRQRMSNQTLRERFGLPETKSATVSLIITETKDKGLIRADESESQSTRYARYIPVWA